MNRVRRRRTAARLVAALVLSGGLVPVMSGAAWACSCVGYNSEEEQYRAAARQSKVIYTGLVSEETRSTPPPSNEPQPPPEVRYTVQVEEDLKGGAAGTREISTSGDEASCGIALRTGARALLVEYAGDRRVGLCDGTTQDRVDQRADIVRDEVRRSPAEPPPPAPGPAPAPEPPGAPSLPHTGGLAVAALAALTAVTAAAAVWSRRVAP